MKNYASSTMATAILAKKRTIAKTVAISVQVAKALSLVSSRFILALQNGIFYFFLGLFLGLKRTWHSEQQQ